MDVYDGIIKSIIEGNHRFEKILSGTEKISKTSRVTFDKHLKQLVKDRYLIRNDQGKQLVEYQINPDASDVAQEFLNDYGEKEFQDKVKKILDSDIDYSKSPKDFRDNLIREYEKRIKLDAHSATDIVQTKHQKLRWLKTQTLLVYLFDKLKENGIIAKSEHGHIYAVIKECFEKADGKEYTRDGLKTTSTYTYNYTKKVGGGKNIDDILSTLITAEKKSNQNN